MKNSKLTDLEREVLRRFFASVGRPLSSESNELDDVRVTERDPDPVGWMTRLLPSAFLTLTSAEREIDWSKIGPVAKINQSTLVGFVVFARDGLVSAIEGYTFDDDWPENIESIEFLEEDS